jgi:hypothetical protein
MYVMFRKLNVPYSRMNMSPISDAYWTVSSMPLMCIEISCTRTAYHFIQVVIYTFSTGLEHLEAVPTTNQKNHWWMAILCLHEVNTLKSRKIPMTRITEWTHLMELLLGNPNLDCNPAVTPRMSVPWPLKPICHNKGQTRSEKERHLNLLLLLLVQQAYYWGGWISWSRGWWQW